MSYARGSSQLCARLQGDDFANQRHTNFFRPDRSDFRICMLEHVEIFPRYVSEPGQVPYKCKSTCVSLYALFHASIYACKYICVYMYMMSVRVCTHHVSKTTSFAPFRGGSEFDSEGCSSQIQTFKNRAPLPPRCFFGIFAAFALSLPSTFASLLPPRFWAIIARLPCVSST